jgi:AAA family ATP:ADP antiporter
MCSYFFLVITSFWILKPIKKTLFIGHYVGTGFDLFGSHFDASQAGLLAKVLNMFVAAVAAIAFSLLSNRLRRECIPSAELGHSEALS